MRKPNLPAITDEFQGLATALKRDSNFQYAAFCMQAAARCEEAMGHVPGQAEDLVCGLPAMLDVCFPRTLLTAHCDRCKARR